MDELTDTPDRRSRHADADRTLQAAKTRYTADRSRMDAVADAMARLGGSTAFLVTHLIWFSAWIVMNTGVAGFVAFETHCAQHACGRNVELELGPGTDAGQRLARARMREDPVHGRDRQAERLEDIAQRLARLHGHGLPVGLAGNCALDR